MLVDIDPEQLSDVIGKIYDSAVDPALWPLALEASCRLIGATFGTVGLYDCDRRSMGWGIQWGGDPHWVKLLHEKYAAIMPFWPIMHLHELGEVANTQSLIEKLGSTEADIRRHSFFTEWAEPAGYRDVAACVVARSENRFATFHLQTPPTRDLVGPRDFAILKLLYPHLRRAVTIGDLLDMRSIAMTAFEATLDTLAIAVVLVDTEARIRHANAAAQAMLSTGAPILVQHGALRASSPQATIALTTAIGRAATDEAQIGLAGIGVPVHSSDGQHAIAHVLPLKFGQLRPDLTHGAVAAVFVTPAQINPLPPMDTLAALYELTPTEARVLLEIASGKNRAATAEALGIADSTVKTHLARIYEKTGTSEQAELAKLVVSLTPPVANSSPRPWRV